MLIYRMCRHVVFSLSSNSMLEIFNVYRAYRDGKASIRRHASHEERTRIVSNPDTVQVSRMN